MSEGDEGMEPFCIETSCGKLIPAYDRTDVRSKYKEGTTFFSSGNVKSIYLQDITEIKTPIGALNVEFVTFYESGAIHRAFPLYGQISGYWSEEEEYALSQEAKVSTTEVTIEAKISSYCFYETGEIKSLTLWPKETYTVQTSVGEIQGRLGISFYKSGKIKSIEPLQSTSITTPIGMMRAYDNEPIGIHGDKNSIQFTEEGKLSSIKTVESIITAIDNKGEKCTLRPKLERDPLDIEQWKYHPMTVKFELDRVIVEKERGDSKTLLRSEYFFETIEKALPLNIHSCDTCTNCAGCQNA